MLFVPIVKYHFNDHLFTDARHWVPYRRCPPANNGCYLVSINYVLGRVLSALNTLFYLITTKETTHLQMKKKWKLKVKFLFQKYATSEWQIGT